MKKELIELIEKLNHEETVYLHTFVSALFPKK